MKQLIALILLTATTLLSFSQALKPIRYNGYNCFDQTQSKYIIKVLEGYKYCDSLNTAYSTQNEICDSLNKVKDERIKNRNKVIKDKSFIISNTASINAELLLENKSLEKAYKKERRQKIGVLIGAAASNAGLIYLLVTK